MSFGKSAGSEPVDALPAGVDTLVGVVVGVAGAAGFGALVSAGFVSAPPQPAKISPPRITVPTVSLFITEILLTGVETLGAYETPAGGNGHEGKVTVW